MFYNEAWENASNFDLVIDIIEAARALSAKKIRANAVTADRAKVDPSLLDAIDIALARQAFA